ncbi:hypothetical protein [Herbidospora daliensis]|uniref:hypothetical protein n=1 Tax=Herbidospora daliensis TaxID=295585 RepID=UPI000AC5BA52|nr:hypothetical protein [Herbidospora daliensis]
MVSRHTTSLELLIPGAAVLAVGAVVAVAVAVPDVSERVAAMAGLTAAIGLIVRRPAAAAAAGVIAWFLTTGFLVNGLGELTFTTGDWLRLGLLTGAGLVGAALRLPMPLRAGGRVSPRAPARVPERMPEGMPARMPGRVPERMPEQAREPMSERVSERVPERVPERMAVGAPVRVPVSPNIGL